MSTKNCLQAIREQRGIAAAQLARDIGVSRPTIYAIEAGIYTPNTNIALQLARVLDCRVEDLFSLEVEAPSEPSQIRVKYLSSDTQPRKGQPLQLCRIGTVVVGVPRANGPSYMSDADGVVSRVGARASDVYVNPLADLNAGKRIVVGGCDPATSILASQLDRLGFEAIAVPCSSQRALEWLKSGLIHIAGSHLHDAETDEDNLPFVKRLFKKGQVRVVSYVTWEQGLVVQHGNPKAIRSIENLTRKGVRLINREEGSGARQLLDRGLESAGISARHVSGYDAIAPGHLPVAWSVSTSGADCCIATRSAARHFDLDFVPLVSERYDFVIPQQCWELPAVRAVLDVLTRSQFRRRLEALTGYDAAHAGEFRS
jgi:putative molybdopterin biosynthesis protein